MDDFFVVHSSDQQGDDLRGVVAADVEDRQARAFRRFFLTRLALIIAGAWLLSWPVHLFPHTLVWALLATAAMVIGLTSPPRTQPTSSDKRLKRPR